MASTTSMTPDVNRGPEILAVCGALSGISTFIVILRLFVRVKVIRQIGWDDWFITAAAAVMLAEMIVIVFEVQYGAGRHVEHIVPASNVITGLHLNFVTQPLCLISLCFTKVSVGLFLLRLTPTPIYRRFIWGLIVFTVLSALGNLFTVLFQCTPLAFIWDTRTPGGKCISPSDLKFAAFFNSSVSLLTDVIFALLPVPILWTVQLNWKVKTAVTGVLSLGIFASASAVVKMTFLSSYGSKGDFLWDSADITLWTTIEICTAMIAASIPSLKPLFKAILRGSSAEYYDNKKLSAKGYMVPSATSKNAIFEMHSRRRSIGGNTAVVTAGAHRDSDSEDSILAIQDGIRKTTHVSVSVS